MIFNVKCLNCSVRNSVYFNNDVNPGQAILAQENWYNDVLFQKWSMNNNNNGVKIGNSSSTYKQAARDYIFEFDKNLWYKTFKIKLPSMNIVTMQQGVDAGSLNGRPSERFGLTKDWRLLFTHDPDVKNYIEYHLDKFVIDWE